jgi:SepF-like predicted cell division protein (DUF552 family)
MRNVKRTLTPKSLQQNAETWKNELLGEIQAAKREARKINSSFYSKYNKKDVKDALKRMYEGNVVTVRLHLSSFSGAY